MGLEQWQIAESIDVGLFACKRFKPLVIDFLALFVCYFHMMQSQNVGMSYLQSIDIVFIDSRDDL